MIVPHLAIHYMNSEKLNFIKYMHITKKKFIVLTNTEPHLVHGCLSETTKVSKGRGQRKQNVFFRALPESPKPSPP